MRTSSIALWAFLVLAFLAAIFPSFAQGNLSGEPISEPSVVFSWALQRCSDNDIPDAPLRALRLANGQVFALDSHFDTRRFLGDDLNSIKRDCTIIYKSRESADPAEFADRTWIVAPWSEDGKKIYALSHNEYQADKHPDRCKFLSYNACWYNTIGLVRSDDEGRSFERVGNKPIAAPAFRQEVDQGRPRGFFGPSNILKNDGYYFSLIRTTGGAAQPSGTCLFRTAHVGEISSWTYFDGRNFVPSALDPYQDNISHVQPCAPLGNIRGAIGSVVRHQRTGLFVSATEFRDPVDQQGQVLISTSTDLINWSSPQVLMHLPLGYAKTCSDRYVFQYPSLLDPESSSINFETVSDYPFLYLTRVRMENCGMTLNRDLIRRRIHLF